MRLCMPTYSTWHHYSKTTHKHVRAYPLCAAEVPACLNVLSHSSNNPPSSNTTYTKA